MIQKIQPLYNKIRPYLLDTQLFSTWQILHSVPVRNACVFDQKLVNADYKPGLASAVTEYVRSDDLVVEVGGGRGVMTVLAAREANNVITFEPAREMRDLLKETIQVSMVEDNVQIRKEIVGSFDDIELIRKDGYGQVSNNIIGPRELPGCDVLVMDCEGGEEQIIHELTNHPRVIIYESHPDRANPHELNSLLESRGYRVVCNRPVHSDTSRQVYTLRQL